MASINLIGRNNGVGLTRDIRLLAEALEEAGHELTLTLLRRGKLTKWLRPPCMRACHVFQRAVGLHERRRHDINLFLEHIHPEDIPFARRNVLMPNPEWFHAPDIPHLERMDLVLAKTRHAAPLFAPFGARVDFVGFTSRDHYDPDVPRKAEFFHLAGRSSNKGTCRLIKLWQRHPEWPRLTIVQHPERVRTVPQAHNIRHVVEYLSDDALRRLQNEHLFHVCPSETEGFGHYLVEAMSVAAVTLTVDAEPMNELVGDDRGLLVPARSAGSQNLATKYQFDEACMADAVERAARMDAIEIARISRRARAWYQANDEAFKRRITTALRQVA